MSATAGSGKTTAVAEALLDGGCPVAWVSLDKSDQATGRLLTYLEAALADYIRESDGLVSEALAARLPHTEVAGLLAESLQVKNVVLVLDNIERLQRHSDAWAVIDALVRFLPDDTHVVLIGREPLFAGALNLPLGSSIGRVGPELLALTLDEATDVLARWGRNVTDVSERVRSVDGWVAGVIFAPESLKATVVGGDDPLKDFLSDHIMSGLTAADQQFLIRTSILPDVDVRQAEALGLLDALDRMRSLRELHLPAAWDRDAFSLRIHPKFREHLQESFSRLPSDEQRQLRSDYAELLTRHRDYESAVEEFHKAGDDKRAVECARKCIEGLLDRGDMALVGVWLERWSDYEIAGNPTSFTAAEVALALAGDRVSDALAVGDRLERAGTLEQFVKESDRAAQLLGWVYSTTGRLREVERILSAAAPTPAMQALRYGVSLITPGPPAPRPSRSNGPLDAFVLQCDYYFGILPNLTHTTESRLLELLLGPFRIAVTSVQGRTQTALDSYRDYTSGVGRMQLFATVGPELLMDAGLIDEAERTAIKGFELAEVGGDYFYMKANLIVQAKLALRHRHDPERARFLLSQGRDLPRFSYLEETADLWLGLALLQEHDDEAAASCLRRVVSEMRANKHLLDLSTACVYLAEAEWRCGEPEAADEAADAAIRAASSIGTNHLLLQALVDFPAVLSRRQDSEASADSEWHSLSRPLSMQRLAIPLRTSEAQVSLQDFGSPRLVVQNSAVRPRLMKTYELLAFLTTQPNVRANRDQLLNVLFPEKGNSQARTYLRQVLKWLRLVLPDGSLIVEDDDIALNPEIVISTESARFERLAMESTRLRGEPRIQAMQDALCIASGGAYLAPVNSEWVDGRRARLGGISLDLEFALAKHLMDADRPLEANTLLEGALKADSLREEGWRLLMRIASEFHDKDGVVRAYETCTTALQRIGVSPSPSTQRLFRDLTSL
ncbi:BTAD domain-containing putative transcriptional regulator [Arthrobacter sp. StoSoilB22]|uniref:BTAD domain-containing putative transcriptional regulator n=1 Tax=Arthrobacter sp. StoSoilB22 TaxID=2830996 RepID=UPI001CC7B3F4|nr:BTAD domain-containing putative transcriptional regulator [Arthrobacter sp. StoSoilB22]BCW62932.1 hypothetical protein StoSoilB22_19050 [Arthrobacter sp. StoSoilB22]